MNLIVLFKWRFVFQQIVHAPIFLDIDPRWGQKFVSESSRRRVKHLASHWRSFNRLAQAFRVFQRAREGGRSLCLAICSKLFGLK